MKSPPARSGDGVALERWFLKFMCGAVASNSIAQSRNVPTEWIDVLFGRTQWPESWALFVVPGTHRIGPADANLNVEFHWADATMLNGLVTQFLRIETLFAMEPPIAAETMLRRPTLLGRGSA